MSLEARDMAGGRAEVGGGGGGGADCCLEFCGSRAAGWLLCFVGSIERPAVQCRVCMLDFACEVARRAVRVVVEGDEARKLDLERGCGLRYSLRR